MKNNDLVIIAITGMMCLAIGIVFFVVLYHRRVIKHQMQLREFKRQKELELLQASIKSEENERMRIASELHDDVGATLAAARLLLTKALRSPGNTSLAEQTNELLEDSIRKVRDISHQLQPGALQYIGLAKALQSFAAIISRSGTVHMEVREIMDPWPEPEESVKHSIYRIVQELVNNIIKHGRAEVIVVSTGIYNDRYCLTITHNGEGLTETEYSSHLYKPDSMGLKNIERRAKSADLSITFTKEDDSNYCITLLLPAIIHSI